MAKAQQQDQEAATVTDASANEAVAAEGTEEATTVEKKVVRIDSGFEYRGADFDAGKYYEVDDVPANFVDWHIVRNRHGVEVPKDKVPSGAEVLPDPRPAVQQIRAKIDAERERRMVANQAPRTRGEEPPADQVQANEAGRAKNFASTENIFGGTHSSDGSHTGGTPLGGEQRHTGGSEEEKASLSTEQKEGVEQPAQGQQSQSTSRPRVPRT